MCTQTGRLYIPQIKSQVLWDDGKGREGRYTNKKNDGRKIFSPPNTPFLINQYDMFSTKSIIHLTRCVVCIYRGHFDPARVTTRCFHNTGPDGTRCLLVLDLVGRKLGRRDTNAVGVAVEEHTLALALGTLGGLYPLAGTSAGPESLEESSPAGVSLGAVVVAHDLLDGLAGFIGVVEGDGADIVVEDMGLDDSVENVTADETEVTVDGGSGATGKVPHLRLVVGERGIRVLEVSDGHYLSQFSCLSSS